MNEEFCLLLLVPLIPLRYVSQSDPITHTHRHTSVSPAAVGNSQELLSITLDPFGEHVKSALLPPERPSSSCRTEEKKLSGRSSVSDQISLYFKVFLSLI